MQRDVCFKLYSIFFLAADVMYVCPFTGRKVGSLFVTNYRIIFQGKDVSGNFHFSLPIFTQQKNEFWVDIFLF